MQILKIPWFLTQEIYIIRAIYCQISWKKIDGERNTFAAGKDFRNSLRPQSINICIRLLIIITILLLYAHTIISKNLSLI